MVFIETDRCLTDAVQAVTGCSLGKRRLKWDYGKMGASFIDMNTQMYGWSLMDFGVFRKRAWYGSN
ncbi:formylmethanofuran dehydrogenase subunit E family protein [Clostridium drakei]|uniref:formylmethanofuran dehydrogenase subunit E family protein n=1 Tax=Clostridium drakei TaxID=332101 RepID=UPI0024189559|nr:formylmethanofuran dehydrogenase subunit E family protein [Clostridium drakei]